MNQRPRLAVFISFDYELFLGSNFVSDDEVLFKPTVTLLDACDRAGAKTTFFADVCSAWAHTRYGQNRYVESFEEQLRDIVRRGHDVQLHVHPHWLRAQPQPAGGWVIDATKTSLSHFGYSDDDDAAPAILRRGVEYLEQLLRPAQDDYRCCAFRAGGLVLQPHEGNAIVALSAAGISIDSTVAPGMVARSELGDINYAHAPTCSYWHVSSDTGLTRPAPMGLVELPIATYGIRPRKRLGFLLRRARSVGQARGTGITRHVRQTRLRGIVGLVRANLRYLGSQPVFLLSCDTKGLDIDILMAGVDQWVAARSSEAVVAVVMICHPKLMFAKQVSLLETFIARVGRQYPGACFATIAEAHEVLETQAVAR